MGKTYSSYYIKPDILIYSSFKELVEKEEYSYYPGIVERKELCPRELLSNYKRVFIVGEPGFGKTRLLKEMELEATKTGESSIFIDAKKIHKSGINDIEEYILKDSNKNKTLGSKLLRDGKYIVCIDALDEIKYLYFTDVVERIEAFAEKYPKINLYISCRYHHFKKHAANFSKFDLQFIQIAPFSRKKTKEYYKAFGMTEKNIEKIQKLLEIREAVGLEKRVFPHLLRHSDAIIRLRKTGNPKALQYHLGHNTPAMTLRYLSTLTQEDALRVQQEVEF